MVPKSDQTPAFITKSSPHKQHQHRVRICILTQAPVEDNPVARFLGDLHARNPTMTLSFQFNYLVRIEQLNNLRVTVVILLQV